jgi:hypothetical protein
MLSLQVERFVQTRPEKCKFWQNFCDFDLQRFSALKRKNTKGLVLWLESHDVKILVTEPDFKDDSLSVEF